MLNSNLVTIVIVTFNAAKTLNTAIESVLNQTYRNIELVIVDGVSSDNTVEIIKHYASTDARVKYISEPDSGIYDAMNKGWKMASGVWILFLGADDELLPDAIDNLMLHDIDSIDAIYGDTILRFPNNTTKLQIAKPASNIPEISVCCHQSIIMRKKCFEKLYGFKTEFKILADYDLILRAYLKGYNYQQINNTISIFRVGGASFSFRNVFEGVKIHTSNNLSNCSMYFNALVGLIRKTGSYFVNNL